MTPYTDMIDPPQVRVVNSFSDAMSWPITVAITNIALVHGRGVVPVIAGLERWQDFTPPGWDGPLRFTLWAGFKCNGQWVLSGFQQFWAGRADTGANPLEIAPDKGINQWQANWAYNGGWSPLDTHVPQPGELMALMVTAGDARYGKIQTVRERSQIVTIPLALDGSWSFTPQAQPDPTPPAPPTNPTDPGIVLPSLTPVTIEPDQYAAIMDRFDRLDHQLGQARAEFKQAGADIVKQLPALLRKALTGR